MYKIYLGKQSVKVFNRIKSLCDNSNGYVKFESECFMPLVMERDGMTPAIYHLFHYYLQQGDVMMDPEISFLVSDEGVIPISYRQDNLGVYQNFIKITDTSMEFRGDWMESTVNFCSTWFKNLKEQFDQLA